jgi:photosystem II stability/assembly factor-like uncharacterized protein
MKLFSIAGSETIIPIICFLLFTPKNITPPAWSLIGPGGGGWLSAITVVNDPGSTMYVGCDVGGIYKSTDQGQTWVIKNNGLSTYYVQNIAYDPQNKNILYAATRGGVFKSINGGESWQSKRDHFPDESLYEFSAPVSDIVVDPKTPSTVYAAIGITRAGYETDSTHWEDVEPSDSDFKIKGSIFKSDNGGENWRQIRNKGINPSALIYSLAINPKETNILYAATDHGIYKSENSGEVWTQINNGLPHQKAMIVVVDPKTPSTLYVTMWADPESDTWQGGVYKSTDSGDAWVAKNNGLPVPEEPGNGYGFTSNFPTLVINPDTPEILYTGNTPWTPDPGVYKTTDGGESWEWVSKPPDEGITANVDMGWITEHGVSVKCLAIAPNNPKLLLFGTSTNLFKTTDGGMTWNQSYSRKTAEGKWQGTGLETTCVQDVTVDPTDSSIIYAGYWDMGLLKSTDSGRSFERLVNGMKKENDYDYSANTFAIIVDPANHDQIYAAAGWWEENKGTVCTSSNQGASWDCEPEGLPQGTVWSITLDEKSPENERVLYAASYKNGIYKSVDSGRSWNAVNTGLGGADNNLQVRKVVIDPNNSQIVYAGIEAKHTSVNNNNYTYQGGLYKTINAGTSWSRIDSNPDQPEQCQPNKCQPSVWDIAVVPGNSQIIYTASTSEYDHSLGNTFPGGVFKSVDGGSTWNRVSSGFGSAENLDVSSIAVHPQNHNILYAVTSDAPYHDQSSGRGIFKSTDAGASWVAFNDGLGVLGHNVITIDPSHPSVLYTGSSGNGVFKRIDSAEIQ